MRREVLINNEDLKDSLSRRARQVSAQDAHDGLLVRNATGWFAAARRARHVALEDCDIFYDVALALELHAAFDVHVLDGEVRSVGSTFSYKTKWRASLCA